MIGLNSQVSGLKQREGAVVFGNVCSLRLQT
jgi:hypothetical protein